MRISSMFSTKWGLRLPALFVLPGFVLMQVPGLADQPAKKRAAPAQVVETSSDNPDAGDHDANGEFVPDVDEDLTALMVPPELLGKVEKVKRLEFTQGLRGLLKDGLSPDGAAPAKRHFDAAHHAVPGDPRAAYAYGLALLEQKNTKEALVQFRAAAKPTTGTYLPAWQACAWIEFVRHEYSSGLTDLRDLARRIEDSKGTWPTERDRVHTAEWLGRTIGFLAGPGLSEEQATKIADTAGSIDKLLTGDRKQAFDHGRKCIAKRQHELEALAARPLDEVVREMNAKRQDAKTAAEVAKDDIKQIEDSIRQVRQPLERQVADANQEIRSNAQAAKNAAKDIPDAEDRVTALSVPQQMPNGFNTVRGRPVSPRYRNENATEKKARETQLATAKQRLDQLKTSAAKARQNMTDARKQREQAQSEMRKAVAARQPELQEARRKSQESAAHLRDVEHAVLSPEQIKSRPKALEAYVPLDPFVERDRLLATLKSE